MMRLIDADAIRLPHGFFEKVDNVPKFYEWLDEQPSVEIIQCKDCSRWCICHRSDDWYCADADRRKD